MYTKEVYTSGTEFPGHENKRAKYHRHAEQTVHCVCVCLCAVACACVRVHVRVCVLRSSWSYSRHYWPTRPRNHMVWFCLSRFPCVGKQLSQQQHWWHASYQLFTKQKLWAYLREDKCINDGSSFTSVRRNAHWVGFCKNKLRPPYQGEKHSSEKEQENWSEQENSVTRRPWPVA